MKIKSMIAGIILLFVLGIGWFVRELTKPLPGASVPDLGREHITDIADIVYNSNPPTSGTHFPIWAKPGLYDRVISDGYLIHSLEHGYVILSYNCDKTISNHFVIPDLIRDLFNIDSPQGYFPFHGVARLRGNDSIEVFAHEEEEFTEGSDSGKLLMHMTATVKPEESWVTPGNPPPKEVELPESFSTDSCKALVESLKPFLKIAPRVIIVPRPNLDSLIALTAWTRIEKLDAIDGGKIKTFITSFHNRGPERTME